MDASQKAIPSLGEVAWAAAAASCRLLFVSFIKLSVIKISVGISLGRKSVFLGSRHYDKQMVEAVQTHVLEHTLLAQINGRTNGGAASAGAPL